MSPACQGTVIAAVMSTVTRTAGEMGAGWKEFRATKPAWRTRSEAACAESCQPVRSDSHQV